MGWACKQQGSLQKRDKKTDTNSQKEVTEILGTHNEERGLGELNTHKSYKKARELWGNKSPIYQICANEGQNGNKQGL